MLYLFGAHCLDTKLLELRVGGKPRPIEPQVFNLLVYLAENSDRVVGKDEIIDAVWDGRAISDATLNSRVNAARRAVGDSGRDQSIIQTLRRRGFRFVADVTTLGEESRPASAPAPAEGRKRQTIRFCTTEHGVRIAYATAGSGPPLVKAANWLNHLDYDWESPVWRHFFAALTRDNLLVRYDARGNGLSDWDIDQISLEAFVRDLENVIDAVGLKRFPLLGISQGCAISIVYAARHPERVSHLILYGGYARGLNHRGTAEELERGAALKTLIRSGWGMENPVFRQIFASFFIPEGTPEQVEWFINLLRKATTPEVAYRIRDALDNIDVENMLPDVRARTLVMHCRDDSVVPFEEGLRMASMIPNARFVALEGHNHLILEEDPAWPKFIEEVGSFLRT
jgi:pimeloyl-ACP methyl ester carboxylesterase